jgi:hypothetical protein
MTLSTYAARPSGVPSTAEMLEMLDQITQVNVACPITFSNPTERREAPFAGHSKDAGISWKCHWDIGR